jgi:hypothetical protein
MMAVAAKFSARFRFTPIMGKMNWTASMDRAKPLAVLSVASIRE